MNKVSKQTEIFRSKTVRFHIFRRSKQIIRLEGSTAANNNKYDNLKYQACILLIYIECQHKLYSIDCELKIIGGDFWLSQYNNHDFHYYHDKYLYYLNLKYYFNIKHFNFINNHFNRYKIGHFT